MADMIRMIRPDDLEQLRTPAFYEAAQRLNDYIKALDLPADQHNGLVSLMLDQVREAELSGFTACVAMMQEDYQSGGLPLS